jgi:membrane protease subunit (stomatin/prohibitin family)
MCTIYFQDAAKLIQTVSKKADQEDVSGIEANLLQVSHQLGRLNEVLQTQNSAIRELNSKVTLLTEEMEDVRNPNFDQVFSYVDRQVFHMLP